MKTWLQSLEWMWTRFVDESCLFHMRQGRAPLFMRDALAIAGRVMETRLGIGGEELRRVLREHLRVRTEDAWFLTRIPQATRQAERASIRIEGEENAAALGISRRGVVLGSLRFGPYYQMGHAPRPLRALAARLGARLTTVFELSKQLSTANASSVRGARSAPRISAQAFRLVHRALRDRSVVAALLDAEFVPPGTPGARVPVRFLGFDVGAPAGAFSAVVRTGSSMALCTLEREAEHVVVRIHEPLEWDRSAAPDAQIQELADKFYAQAEGVVRRRPAQWRGWIGLETLRQDSAHSTAVGVAAPARADPILPRRFGPWLRVAEAMGALHPWLGAACLTLAEA